jgi:uncharacterized protein YcgI (DUF1989 family)
VNVPAGAAIQIVNTHGNQVVDTWALVRNDPAEALSMPHTRGTLRRLSPRTGDILYTDRRQALLKLEADTSPGRHDTLIPACDLERYRQLGARDYHANCCDNFLYSIAAAELRPRPVPAPLNLFMNIPWTLSGDLSFDAPLSRPGDYVVLRALRDAVVILSACPQDMVPINGSAKQPADVGYRVFP